MPVYRAQNRKKTARRRPGLLVIILIVAAVVAVAALLISIFGGGAAQEAMAAQALEDEVTGEGPAAALEAIYAANTTRGVADLSTTVLDEQFGVAPGLYLKAWGCYTENTYGIADVFIFRTMEGQQNALREALEQVKTNRIVETRSYDIYNSAEYAEEGQIFEVGDDYMCLIMIENADQVRETLEKYLVA